MGVPFLSVLLSDTHLVFIEIKMHLNVLDAFCNELIASFSKAVRLVEIIEVGLRLDLDDGFLGSRVKGSRAGNAHFKCLLNKLVGDAIATHIRAYTEAAQVLFLRRAKDTTGANQAQRRSGICCAVGEGWATTWMDVRHDVVRIWMCVRIVDLGEGGPLFIDENIYAQFVECVHLMARHAENIPASEVHLRRG